MYPERGGFASFFDFLFFKPEALEDNGDEEEESGVSEGSLGNAAMLFISNGCEESRLLRLSF